MSFEIIATKSFIKDLKILSKKYASLKDDLLELQNRLFVNPKLGSGIGKDCFKVRLAIKSKSKGKSSGARCITCVKVINRTVYLLAIYDKSEQSDLKPNDLKILLEEAGINTH